MGIAVAKRDNVGIDVKEVESMVDDVSLTVRGEKKRCHGTTLSLGEKEVALRGRRELCFTGRRSGNGEPVDVAVAKEGRALAMLKVDIPGALALVMGNDPPCGGA